MILKSSRIHTRGRGEAETLAHLLHGAENEAVRVLRGTTADVRDAFSDAHRHARTFAIRHFIIAPAQAATPAQMLGVLDQLGVEFGFDPATAFVVEHRKARAVPDSFPVHLHALVPEVDPESGRVLASAHSYARQERVAREAEHALGEPFVRGAHHRAVLAILRSTGKVAIADALDTAFPEAGSTPRPRAAYTDARYRQAARAGVDLPVAQQAVAAAWKGSTTRSGFEAALAQHGLVSRPGDKPDTWVVETRDGKTFVGSLARLVRVRKAAITNRMEQSHEHPVPAIRAPEQRLPTDPRTGDVPQHEADPHDPRTPRRPRDAHGGNGGGGRPDRDADVSPACPPGGPGAAAGGAGGPSRPIGHPESGSGSAGRRAGLRGPRPTAEAVRLFLSLDRPDRITLLHDAKALANIGAKSDIDRARDALVGMREAAEQAKVLVRSATVPEPADLATARTANIAAGEAARTARAEAEAATTAIRSHAAVVPTGWRRVVGWASGTTDRHRAAGAALTAIEAQRTAAVAEAEERARQAAVAVRKATERHQAAIRSCRETYQAEAATAPARIAAVEAALELLYQRPELARVGPAGLLRAGYSITDMRKRLTLVPEAEADVTVGSRWGL